MRFFTNYKLSLLAVIIFPVAFAQAQLIIQAGATLKTTGNAVITLQDIDLVNNGTINQQTGEGKFVFAGTADNYISGSNNPLFDIFEIAKTGLAKILLSQNINIGSSIHFTSGLIDLNSNNILLQPTAFLNGENESSRITGTSGGYIEIINALNAPSAINPGNLGAVITSAQNLGSTTIRRGHGSQVNGSGSGNSIYRYFDITPANDAALNAILHINYFDAELNGLLENTLTVWKSTNSNTWFDMGYSNRDATANYVEQAGLADFSRWTLSSSGNILPVYFLLFNVDCDNNAVRILWKTAQEQSSARFDVQKSEDGIHFKTITTMQAAGNSSTEKTYSTTDNSPSSNVVFYRIAETDINGRTQYTGVNRIQCGGNTTEIKYWPNPVNQTMFVNVYAESSSPIGMKLFDSKGVLVFIQNNSLMRGSNQFSINMGNLASGNYMMLLEWNNGQNHKSIKLLKQ